MKLDQRQITLILISKEIIWIKNYSKHPAHYCQKDSLSSGISILKASLSPILTVSTSLASASKIRILGGGASGAEVMGIMSGSLVDKTTG